MDHQPDHFARREVVARGLVCELVEAADQVIEDPTHLLVRRGLRVQVHVAELGDDEEEEVRLAHPLNLGLKLEKTEDAAHLGREVLHVADEVLLDVVGVALQLLEVERRVVVGALASGLVERGVMAAALRWDA